jgi:DNA-binding NtrC family response regulator
MRFLWGKAVPRHILVVDSDRDAAGSLSEVIAGFSSGYEVLRAYSGFEGIQKIEKGVVNIILAAEKLADMTGSTFINILQSLKKSKKNNPACVLMAAKRKRVEVFDVECPVSFDVIHNPVDPDELAYVLNRAMDLDGLNEKIQFNKIIWRVLLGLVPVAVAVGVVMGIQ